MNPRRTTEANRTSSVSSPSARRTAAAPGRSIARSEKLTTTSPRSWWRRDRSDSVQLDRARALGRRAASIRSTRPARGCGWLNRSAPPGSPLARRWPGSGAPRVGQRAADAQHVAGLLDREHQRQVRHRRLDRLTPLHPPAWYTSSPRSTRPRSNAVIRTRRTRRHQRRPADTSGHSTDRNVVTEITPRGVVADQLSAAPDRWSTVIPSFGARARRRSPVRSRPIEMPRRTT